MKCLIAILSIAAFAACASQDDAVERANSEVRITVRTLAHAGGPDLDLSALTAEGPPGAPDLAGGGVGGPAQNSGGLGYPQLDAPITQNGPSQGNGGVAPGPSGSTADPNLVALACDVFEALFGRAARCTNDPTGFLTSTTTLFSGQTCEAYVQGILTVSPEPITPAGVQILKCLAALFRNTACDYDLSVEEFINQCAPAGGF